MHGGISDPILSSLRVFINAHSRSIVSSVYDSLQHPYIILAKNGPTKTYLLYMYLSSLTEWSHSLAWFERPADNRKVLCSNHNGTTTTFWLGRKMACWVVIAKRITNFRTPKKICVQYGKNAVLRGYFRPLVHRKTSVSHNSPIFRNRVSHRR